MSAGTDATIELSYQASEVYLVLGGSGRVAVSVNGSHARTIDVAGVPDLYTVIPGPQYGRGLLTLHVSPGVQAYDFTFG